MPADDSSNRQSPVKLGSGLKRIKSDSDDSEIRGKQASRNARLFSFNERKNNMPFDFPSDRRAEKYPLITMYDDTANDKPANNTTAKASSFLTRFIFISVSCIFSFS